MSLLLKKNSEFFILLLFSAATPILPILTNNLSILNGKIFLTALIFFAVNVFFVFTCKKIFELFFDSYRSTALSILTLFLFYLFSEISDFAYDIQSLSSFLDKRLILIFLYAITYFVAIKLDKNFVYIFAKILVLCYFAISLAFIIIPKHSEGQVSKNEKHLLHSKQFQDVKFSEKPNVYIITVDGYGRKDKLLQYLNFSNDLIPFLEKNGFKVIENSHSNYPITFLSLASTFAGEYIFQEGQHKYTRTPLYNIIGGNNPVARLFEENGYLLVHGEGGAHDVANCSNPKALRIKKSFFEIDSFIYEYVESRISPEFFGVMLNKTPLYILNNAFVNHIIVTIDQVTRNIEHIRSENPEKPLYLYSYTIPPHPPFIFNPDCSVKRVFKNKKNLGDSKDKEGYLDNLRCTNKNIVNFVNYINKTDPTAIVVFFSDHGTDFTVNWMEDPQKWSRESIEERFSNLIAMKLPKRCSEKLPKTLSNINIFPQIFSCLSGKDIKFEMDRHFVTIYENTPFEGKFVEVDFK